MFESCRAHHNRPIINCIMINSLVFEHSIPVEVFTEAETMHIKLLINGESCFEKEYAGGVIHKDLIHFDREYDNGSKNKMSWHLSGTQEVEEKYLKVSQISINGQSIDVYNAEYFPEINTDWWQRLDIQEQEKYNDMIYGNIGNTFGWYGEVNYYYYSGFDFRAKSLYKKDNRDPEILLHKKNNWIFLDKDSAKGHDRIK